MLSCEVRQFRRELWNAESYTIRVSCWRLAVRITSSLFRATCRGWECHRAGIDNPRRRGVLSSTESLVVAARPSTKMAASPDMLISYEIGVRRNGGYDSSRSGYRFAVSVPALRPTACFLALTASIDGICVCVVCRESESPFESPAVPSFSASAPRTGGFREGDFGHDHR